MTDMSDGGEEEVPPTINLKSARVIVGGNLGQYPAVFSSDGLIIFCCLSVQIKMFSVASSEQLGVLSGHTAPVTSVIVNPQNRLQLYSGALDGTIKLWDYLDMTCLASFNIQFPILHMCLKWDHFICNVSIRGSQKQTCHILACPVGDEKTKTLYSSRNCGYIATHGDFIATISKKTLTLYNFKTGQKLKYTHDRMLTTVAFHPNDPYLATGDSDGQIIFWDRYEDFNHMVTWRNHWHAHAVQSLAFTDDGAYLLSGGEEAVLVMWQLATGHKQFLPRLGSTIRHISISPDGNLYALACADSSIRVVNTVTTSVKAHIRGLQHAHCHPVPPSAWLLRTGLVREPKNSYLLLSGMPGYLQVYDAFEDRHVLEIDVGGHNLVSRIDKEPMPVIQIEHVAINKNGSFLAAIETRVHSETNDATALKIFGFDASSNSYVLNTRIDNPHDGQVTALVFHPSLNILVSASMDRTFKVWQQHATSWACRSIGRYRDSDVNHAAFSPDGSLLAVAHMQVITLWDVMSLSLRHTLLQAPSEPLRMLTFCQDSPFLVAVGATTLTVWNLLTASVWWTCVLPVVAVAADPFSPHFAVIATPFDIKDPVSSQMLLFHPKNPAPLCIWGVPDVQIEELLVEAAPRPYEERPPAPTLNLKASLAFVYPRRSRATSSASLVYLTRRRELARLDSVYAQAEVQQKKPSPIQPKPKQISVFEKVYGKSMVSDSVTLPEAPPSVATSADPKNLLALFEGPTHLLPPISKLYLPFMKCLLRKAPQEVPTEKALPAPAAPAAAPPPVPQQRLLTEDEIFERDTAQGVFKWEAARKTVAFLYEPETYLSRPFLEHKKEKQQNSEDDDEEEEPREPVKGKGEKENDEVKQNNTHSKEPQAQAQPQDGEEMSDDMAPQNPLTENGIDGIDEKHADSQTKGGDLSRKKVEVGSNGETAVKKRSGLRTVKAVANPPTETRSTRRKPKA